ncbi:MAG: hypothetical protein COB24_12970 [Hyphomicrobiales bacterium]|nr:MAG: hypothetical protein COB24_12970 [Hyphomicrobiales bacterium]
MTIAVYVQNSKFEWLQSTLLYNPIFSSKKSDALDFSAEKYATLDFSTEKYAVFIAGLCGITDFHITVTSTRHFVAGLCGVTDCHISITTTRHYE